MQLSLDKQNAIASIALSLISAALFVSAAISPLPIA